MRGIFTKRTSRQAKRTLLFAMLAATAIPSQQNSAYGQTPASGMNQSRYENHQLPVKIVHRAPAKVATLSGGVIRSNPFVTVTVPVAPQAPVIQLASGNQPSIRLKSTGNSIGFAPIGGLVVPAAPLAAPAQLAAPAPALPTNVPKAQAAPIAAAPFAAAPMNVPAIGAAAISPQALTEQQNVFHSATPQMSVSGHSAGHADVDHHSARTMPTPTVVGVPSDEPSVEIPTTLTPTIVAAPQPRLMDDRPLIESAPSAISPFEAATASASSNSMAELPPPIVAEGNAFEKHQAARSIPDAPVTPQEPRSLGPVAAATPIDDAPVLERAIDSTDLANETVAKVSEVETPVVDVASKVVPVTDARDDQYAIQETQPIFFSLSDSSDATDTDFESAEAAETENEDVDLDVVADQASPEVTEVPTSMSLSDVPDETSDSPTGTLSAVETPVHFNPVVTLAEQIPAPGAGEKTPIRVNPNVKDDDIILGDSKTIRSLDQSPQVARQPIAVAMPPTVIARTDEAGVDYAPAVDAIAHDPTASSKRKLPTIEFDAPAPMAAQQTSDASRFEKQVAEYTHSPAAIHVATDAPRFADGATESAGPVVEMTAPVTEMTAPVAKVTASVAEVPASVAEVPASVAEVTAPIAATSPANHSQPNQIARSGAAAAASTVQDPMRLASSQRAIQPKLSSYRAASRVLGPAKNRKPVALNLSRAQVRSMTIGGRLRRVSIANKDICQAFASGPNQLKLIGTGIGKTKLTIWADIAPGEPTRVQSFDIDVSNDVDATGDKISAHTALLNDSIDKAFPRASVVVSRQAGKLIVTGRCDDEDTAKQIVRMVRKSCLVPVQDNLQVR